MHIYIAVAWLAHCHNIACIVVGVGEGKNLEAVLKKLKTLAFVESWTVQEDGGAVFVKLKPYDWFSEDPDSPYSPMGIKANVAAGFRKFGSCCRRILGYHHRR